MIVFFGLNLKAQSQSTLSGTNQPMIIIDGRTIQPQSDTESILSSLNSNDIESMEVLKDANSAAQYGSAGINGVIIIYTMKFKAKVGQKKIGSFSGKYQKYINENPSTKNITYVLNGETLVDTVRLVPRRILDLPVGAIKKVAFKKPSDNQNAIVNITTKP